MKEGLSCFDRLNNSGSSSGSRTTKVAVVARYINYLP